MRSDRDLYLEVSGMARKPVSVSLILTLYLAQPEAAISIEQQASLTALSRVVFMLGLIARVVCGGEWVGALDLKEVVDEVDYPGEVVDSDAERSARGYGVLEIPHTRGGESREEDPGVDEELVQKVHSDEGLEL